MFNLALKHNQQYSIGYCPKGVALHKLSKYNDALVYYDNAIQIDSKDAKAYFNKDLPYNIKQFVYRRMHKLSKYNDALVYYDNAIQIDPKDAKAYFNKDLPYNIKQFVYRRMHKLSKYNDALVYYDNAIYINPNDAKAYFNKGALLKNIKKYSSAVEKYEQAIKYCKSDENKFKSLMMEIKNTK